MHENHPGGDERDLQHFTRRKNGVAVGMSAKHAAQHSRGDGKIGRPKKYPCDADGGISGEPAEESSREMVRPRPVLEQSANNPFDDEIRAMKQTPNYKCPGRAVPESTKKHYYDQMRPSPKQRDLIAPERNIEVVAQECGKRDVPASQEIGKANGRVRKTKIVLQMKAKTECRANSAGGITGEIKKYLTGKCDDAQPGIQRDEWTSVTKNAIGRTGKHRVGEHDFFEQTEGHEQQSPEKLARAQGRRPDKLGKKIAGSHNWAGDQLRKKGNGQDKIAQGFRRLQDAAINVERVGERMKRVEGDADRQKNIEMRWLINDSEAREQPLKVLEQKIPVFEEPEHAQVHADAANQPGAARMLPFGLRHLSAEPKIHCRRGKEQRGKRRVPRAVKNVARDDEEIFPRVPGMHVPVSGDDDCKKDNEGERIEKHDRRATAYLRPMSMASTFCRSFHGLAKTESPKVQHPMQTNLASITKLG